MLNGRWPGLMSLIFGCVMGTGTRLTPALALVGLGGLLVHPLTAQQEGQRALPRPPVLHIGDVPIGSLGHPLGTYLTVEGVLNRELKTGPMTIDRINGRKLSTPVELVVEGVTLPEAVRCVLKGYETAHMIGMPPALVAAAKEVGKEPPPGGQAAWQVHLEFAALLVVSPQGLQIHRLP